MITLVFDKLLYVLLLEHRGSVKMKMFGAKMGLHVNTGFSGLNSDHVVGLEYTYPFNSKNLR
jgi:hypothetical protein